MGEHYEEMRELNNWDEADRYYEMLKDKKDDWFDTHVEVIGLSKKSNKAIKGYIKEQLEDQIISACCGSKIVLNDICDKCGEHI